MATTSTVQNPRSDFIGDIRIQMDGTPGEVQIDMIIDVNSSEEIADNFTGGPAPIDFIGDVVAGAGGGPDGPWNVEVSVNQRRFGRVKSVLSGALDSIASQAGIGAQMLLADAQNTTGGFDVSPFSRTAQINAGETERINSVVRFQPMVIPVPEGVSLVDTLEDRLGGRQPSINFTFDMPKDSNLTRVQETYSVDVPLTAFVEEREITLNCSQLYSDTINQIETLRANAQSKLNGVQDARRRLESFGNELITNARSNVGGGSLVDRLGNLSPTDLANSNTSRLQKIRSNVEGIDTREQAVSDIREQVEDLRSEVRNNMEDRCVSELNAMDKLDQIDSSILGSLENISSEVAELKSNILDALRNIESIDCGDVYSSLDEEINQLESTIGVGVITGSLGANLTADRFESLNEQVNEAERKLNERVDVGSPCNAEFGSRINDLRSELRRVSNEFGDRIELSCADIPNLRSDVDSFEGAVQNFTSKDQLARLPEDRDRLIEEASDVISRIRQQASDDNPCKQQLISRVNRALSQVRRAGVRPRTAIPCEQRFESVGQAVEEFENQILSLSPPVSPDQMQSVASQGNQLVEDIEENVPADSDCRVELSERTRQLVERAESLTAQVRIDTEQATESQERREELVDQLLGSIETVRNASDEVDDIGETL